MWIKLSRALLFVIIISSCSPLHFLGKYQSDKSFKKTENKNFAGVKAKTQWWYFDCFLDNGAVLVVLVNPHQWWSETAQPTAGKSLFYVSYTERGGKAYNLQKVFDTKDFLYDKDNITCPYFSLTKIHKANSRKYQLKFDINDITGSATITTGSKGFSPLPTGSMGILATKYILKLKGKDLAFRYAAHVPQGNIEGTLDIKGNAVEVKGKSYHEQGWFTGNPEQMGKGWSWFHFVSKNINIFGKPGDFVCIEKEGKRIAAGIFPRNYVLENEVYLDKSLISSTINFSAKGYSFRITPTGEQSTPLIGIPSFVTGQFWGNVLQKSTICLTVNGQEIEETGDLLLESCTMAKDSIVSDGVSYHKSAD